MIGALALVSFGRSGSSVPGIRVGVVTASGAMTSHAGRASVAGIWLAAAQLALAGVATTTAPGGTDTAAVSVGSCVTDGEEGAVGEVAIVGVGVDIAAVGAGTAAVRVGSLASNGNRDGAGGVAIAAVGAATAAVGAGSLVT